MYNSIAVILERYFHRNYICVSIFYVIIENKFLKQFLLITFYNEQGGLLKICPQQCMSGLSLSKLPVLY